MYRSDLSKLKKILPNIVVNLSVTHTGSCLAPNQS